MSASDDVVLLYLGPRSCYTGLHHSNKYENCLYVEFKNNIRHRSTVNSHRECDDKDVLWDNNIVKFESCADDNSPVSCYAPNADVKWSKMVGEELKDRNLLPLGYCNQFNTFHCGTNFFTENDLADEFEDKIRLLTEKCDMFRGFLNMYDSNTGYGGLLAQIYPLLTDVYGRKSALTFSIGNDKPPNLFEFDSVSSNSVCSFIDWNTFQTRQFSNILNKNTDYHNSAMTSLALHQVLQIIDTEGDLKEVASIMSPLSRNIFSTALGVPFDHTDTEKFPKLFNEHFFNDTVHPISRFIDKLEIPLHNTFISCSDLDGLQTNHQFLMALNKLQHDNKFFGSTTRFSYHPSPMQLSTTFPQFFNNMLLSSGRLRRHNERCRECRVHSLPAVLVLQNTRQCNNIIKEVLKPSIRVNKSSELLTAGVLDEDISDIRQHLFQLSDNYDER